MSRRHKQSCLVLAALALLVCAWLVQIPLSRLQASHRLSPTVQEPLEVIPILVLGGFRGVVVDFLWIRGIARHEEKRYFELKTIFDMIANLQPNIPDVWIFQGWNMAYNIAHNMETKEGKWKWVRAGLAYMTRGAGKNPTNGEIRAALGHMYRHKFSEKVFPLPRVQYYRKQLAKDGLDNFQEAVKWYREAIERGLKITTKSVIARCVAHTYHQAAQFAMKEKRWEDAVNYFGVSLKEWKAYPSTYQEGHKLYLSNCSNVASSLGKLHAELALRAKAQGRGGEALVHFRKAAASYRVVIDDLCLPLLPHHAKISRMAQKEAGILTKPALRGSGAPL